MQYIFIKHVKLLATNTPEASGPIFIPNIKSNVTSISGMPIAMKHAELADYFSITAKLPKKCQWKIGMIL
jgi:hypothetical protein